uniref:Putative conserved membrane-anchored protein n=1 Tax=uncultured bacterium RM57 TaxID=561246 RepID=C8XT84_9BACT|nr:putative conserved membrane-anchored protein [uncultured bacterium RM57]
MPVSQQPPETETKPVTDSVPKVAGDVAVGEDLDFQRRWWRFEKIVWTFFLLLIICDLIGLFGRGYLAKAQRTASDGTLRLTYERIERSSTPSIMTLHFGPSAIRDGQIKLFISESIVRRLGAQRISPQPAQSVVGNGGFTYTFPATTTPATVEISLEPSFPGREHFNMGVVGAAPIGGSVFVVP